MTVLERKKRFIQSVMIETDDVFVELEKAYKKISKREPCMFTADELRKSIAKFEKDLAEGNVNGISHEEMKKKYAL